MSSHLIESLATTTELADVFSDRSLLQAMLDFEIALAQAEAAVGLIPRDAAAAIASSTIDGLDAVEIGRSARSTGTVSIGFVTALATQVRSRDPKSADFVHFGATSQDVADTAMALTLRRAVAILAAEHARLDGALRQLSDAHAHTIMLGRTLLQPATPITFGLKAAGWVAALSRGWRRVDVAAADAIALQFGGAAGTLAALGERGPQVAPLLARHLGLPEAVPWHTQRDRLAAFVCASGVYVATLGKVARDVSLLMQHEVGEVAEPGGGSSTMPHKRNPAASAIVLAAANRTPGLVAAFLAGMVQEHERSAGGWHAEWPTVAHIVQATGSALAALADAASDLSVDVKQMRANIDRTNGTIFAERAMALLLAPLGKKKAEGFIGEALAEARKGSMTFGAALSAIPEVVRVLDSDVLRRIDVPEDYLGAAELFRAQLLDEARR
jgi:3-carboxy-cis,cis-muconate cycloisomerase